MARSSRSRVITVSPESPDIIKMMTKNSSSSNNNNNNNTKKRSVKDITGNGSTEEDVPEYYSYMPVELTNQLGKLQKSTPLTTLLHSLTTATTTPTSNTSESDENKVIIGELRELVQSWEYQYCVTWMYCTFPSYYTKQSKNNGSLSTCSFFNQQKNKNINGNLKFHEFLLLQDIHDYCLNGGNFHSDRIQPNDIDNVFLWFLIEISRSYHNDKTIGCSVSSILKHGEYFSEEWSTITILQKFKIIFTVCKTIELKSIGLRNYILSNQDLWYFPKFDVLIDSKKNIMENYICMHGGKIIKIEQEIGKLLDLPLDLNNCIVEQKKEGNNISEEMKKTISYSVDYFQKIEEYSESINVKYTVCSFEFESLVEFNTKDMLYYPIGQYHYPSNGNDDGDDDESARGKSKRDVVDNDDDGYTLVRVLENQIFGLKLYLNRNKQRDVAVMLHSRKRSDRLIALEEDKFKKSLEDSIYSKLAYRKSFLKKKTSKRGKILKLIKSYINEKIWFKFDQEYLKKQQQLEVDGTVSTFGQFDNDILQDLSNEFHNLFFQFHTASLNGESSSSITETNNSYDKTETVFLEIPDVYCINDSDLDKLDKHDLSSTYDLEKDNKKWLFHTLSNRNKYIELENDLSKIEEMNINGDIICCDRCNQWSYYQEVIYELEINQPYRDIIQLINPDSMDKPFAFVPMGHVKNGVVEESVAETGNDVTTVAAVEAPVNESTQEQEITLTDEDIVKNNLMKGLDVNIIVPKARRSTTKNVSYTKEKKYIINSDGEEEELEDKEYNANDKLANDREEEEQAILDNSKLPFLKDFPLYDITVNRPLNKLIKPYYENEQYIDDVLFSNEYYKKFVCLCCVSNLEKQMREVQFEQDLKAYRLKELRNWKIKEKREEKRLEQLEKKQQQQQQQQQPSAEEPQAVDAIPVGSVTPGITLPDAELEHHI